MINYVEPQIKYNMDRTFQRLKIEANTAAYQQAAALFPTLMETLSAHMEMAQCYVVAPNRMTFGVAELDGCQRLVTCLSTCTDHVRDKVKQLMGEGDYLAGYILDDLANEVLFQGADQMNLLVAQRMETEGYHLTCRYSPGEPPLGLEHQKALLEQFLGEPSLAHLQLTEGLMLSPERTMICIFGADQNIPAREPGRECNSCPNESCHFRKTE